MGSFSVLCAQPDHYWRIEGFRKGVSRAVRGLLATLPPTQSTATSSDECQSARKVAPQPGIKFGVITGYDIGERWVPGKLFHKASRRGSSRLGVHGRAAPAAWNVVLGA